VSCFLATAEWGVNGYNNQIHGSAIWEVTRVKFHWRVIIRVSDNDNRVTLRYLRTNSARPDEEIEIRDNAELRAMAGRVITSGEPDLVRILGYEMLRHSGRRDMQLAVILNEFQRDRQEFRRVMRRVDGQVITIIEGP
jgi:hypothetical protein